MKRRSKGRKPHASKASDKISSLSLLKVLKSNPEKPLNYKQIAAKLEIDHPTGRNLIIRKLAQLVAKKQIEKTGENQYKILLDKVIQVGILDMNSKGFGHVIIEGTEEDVAISEHNLNKAFHGDQIEVYIFKRRRNGKPEGEILKILKRAKDKFIGVLEIQKNYAFLHVDDPKMYTDIFIPKNKLNKAKHGEKVQVKLTDWPEDADSPLGKVIQVLGQPGSHQTEMHAILAQYGLPPQFPDEVIAAANALDTTIQKEEIQKRRDMREILTFTIDPKDAKDFDDAISFRVLDSGNFEVGIHIADVSHYVTPNSLLDTEAYQRATSVYLVDRVVPMLPEILSNFACSLRPREEKYTFSAVFEINAQAEVIDQWFGRTVIYSDARFAYEEAQHIIENESNTIPDTVSLTGTSYQTSDAIVTAISTLDQLAKRMRAARMEQGALSFDKVEVRFRLDPENNPTEVIFKTAKDANKLIEEFMLLANRSVAEFIGKQKQKKTFVYRVHDEPDIEKLSALQKVVGRFGLDLNLKNKKTITSSLNKLLQDVQGKKEQNMVDTLAIRSMSKAEYTTQNIGHYGLCFSYYSHFTSPIRRYPDVIAHRLLQHYLDQGASVSESEYKEKCQHCSNMENLAAQAERDSIKYMQIKYMQNQKENEFLGVISGVTEWGIYVEIIENKCEGMIRIRDLKDDYFTFDPKEYAVIGAHSKHKYRLGDEVYVRLKKADLIKRHLDFEMLS